VFNPVPFVDIRHEAGPYIGLAKPLPTATLRTIDIYLADYTERLPGLYLQPGWIASIPITEPVTYGEVRELIFNNDTELEVGVSVYLFSIIFVYRH